MAKTPQSIDKGAKVRATGGIGGLSLCAVSDALRVLRVPPTPGEYDLHRMVAQALSQAEIPFEHEVRLGPRCRIDFLSGGVGIEVKKGLVSARALREQAARYLAFDRVDALLLVTTRGARLPAVIAGKPVVVFGLNRLWGVTV